MPIRQVIAALLCFLSLAAPALAQQIAGKVVGVTDGDTIKVLAAGNKQYKIRLNGIDCPESDQPFGQAAKQFTSKAVSGKQVTVVTKDVDKYGRTVAVILGPDGKNLNQSLVRNGYAWWYRQYSPNDASLQQLEAEARAVNCELWAEAKVTFEHHLGRLSPKTLMIAASSVDGGKPRISVSITSLLVVV